MSLNAGITRVVGTCGPRHRSHHARSPVLRVEVVVDGELGAADLHHLVELVARAALEADQLELVRLVRELGARLVLGDDAAREALARLDDLLHPLLERREVVRGERALDVEVVVEAVADRRADAELGLGEQLLHRLGEHVRGRVPQHRAAVLGVDRDRLEHVAVGHDVGQVAAARRRRGRPRRCGRGTPRRRWCPPAPSRSSRLPSRSRTVMVGTAAPGARRDGRDEGSAAVDPAGTRRRALARASLPAQPRGAGERNSPRVALAASRRSGTRCGRGLRRRSSRRSPRLSLMPKPGDPRQRASACPASSPRAGHTCR